MSMRRCFVFALALIATSASASEKHPGMDAFVERVAAGDTARADEVRSLLEAAEFQPAIIAAMTRPAEGTKAWFEYRPIFMTEARIQGGAEFYGLHREALESAAATYGVPAEYVVSIIGVETFYGRITGKWKVLDALATLAFHYPPRAPFFQGELEGFIRMPQARQITLDQRAALGSYAGAMGLGQFMPTSFIKWAVDADSDGRIELWAPGVDLFASVANYLKEHGWVQGGPVVEPMVPGPNAKRVKDTGLDPIFPLSQLVAWGYQPAVQGTLAPTEASNLLTLETAAAEFTHYAIFGNFRVITRYNRSPMYAMAVHQLAKAIAIRMQVPAADSTENAAR